MADPLVLVDRQPHVATVRIQRPPLNVYTIALLEELAGALRPLAEDTSLRVVVLRGAGKCFSAGVDVGEHGDATIRRMLAAFRQAASSLAAIPCATVASVHGHCLGGGFEMAATCDIVYARKDAQFGVPEISLGVFPPAAAAAFPALVGSARAADLLLTGRTIGAEEAAGMGFVSQVFPEAEFDAKVAEAVGRIAGMSGAALRTAKRALRTAQDPFHHDRLLAIERLYLAESAHSEDAREGLAAFLEKRKPAWKDR